MANHISYDKNTVQPTNRVFERQLQTQESMPTYHQAFSHPKYNQIHENKLSYVERPRHSAKIDHKQASIDFSKYMRMNGRPAFGYNNHNLHQQPRYQSNNYHPNQPHYRPNLTVQDSNREIEVDRFTVQDANLPPNIYHNFSSCTRLDKKNVIYDINKRNTYS
jgi:hypothetical protein